MGGDVWDGEELTLITRGRRTGRRHAVQVWFAREGDVLWLRADERSPDWLLNLRVEPRCVVHVRETERAATYEPIEDRDGALRRLVELWRAKYGAEWVQPWYVERGREPVRLRVEGAAW